MSVDFTVLCTRPLPSEWRARPDLGDLPFSLSISDVAQWRSDTAEWLAENAPDGGDPFLTWLKEQLGKSWSFVVSINCRPAAAALVESCARVLTEAFGGVYYDDHSAEIVACSPGRDDVSAGQVIARWQFLHRNKEAASSLELQEAKEEWAEGAAQDPESYREADDWSDV
jgi:hypothetical protein